MYKGIKSLSGFVVNSNASYLPYNKFIIKIVPAEMLNLNTIFVLAIKNAMTPILETKPISRSSKKCNSQQSGYSTLHILFPY